MSFQVADTALQASFEDIDRLEKILHKSSGGRWLIPVLPIFRYFSSIWSNKNFGRHFVSYIEYIRWGIIYQILKICHSVFQDQNQKSKSWCCEVTKKNKNQESWNVVAQRAFCTLTFPGMSPELLQFHWMPLHPENTRRQQGCFCLN